jgi:hypothetical protein
LLLHRSICRSLLNAGVIIPGMKGQKQPIDPNVAKLRPEKSFDASNYMRGGGGQMKRPAFNPEQPFRDSQRQDSMELMNGPGNGIKLAGSFNADGARRDPHKIQHEGFEVMGTQGGNLNNNNLPSYNLLENQRTETVDTFDTWRIPHRPLLCFPAGIHSAEPAGRHKTKDGKEVCVPLRGLPFQDELSSACLAPQCSPVSH